MNDNPDILRFLDDVAAKEELKNPSLVKKHLQSYYIASNI